jgi:hypothetical protein
MKKFLGTQQTVKYSIENISKLAMRPAAKKNFTYLTDRKHGQFSFFADKKLPNIIQENG